MKIRSGIGKIYMSELACLTGGELIGDDRAFSCICTDSREADGESLFVAMRGERVDGHDFIEKAKENGALCVLSERPPKTDGVSAVVVEDSVAALSKIAKGKKSAALRKTVAITGSVGKTTTKEFVYSALRSQKIYKTEGNYNSVIGLPLSLLSVPTEAELAVFEMGMSGFSEIESMSLAAEPDIAIITNIGSSHLEMLGTRENIRKAKLEIVAGLREGGTLLINGDDPMLFGYDTGVLTMSVSVSNKECDFFAEKIESDSFGTSFTACFPNGTRERAYINQLGEHNVRAAMFGFAAAYLIGIDPIIAKNGIASFTGAKMRQNIYRAGDYTFIEDCYNASPESMRAAIDVLASVKKTRAVALLGDMKELGANTAELHRGVGEYAAKKGADIVFTFGELAENIADRAEECGAMVFRTASAEHEAAAEKLLANLENGDTVLFKASRSMKAENIIKILKERMGIKDDEF